MAAALKTLTFLLLLGLTAHADNDSKTAAVGQNQPSRPSAIRAAEILQNRCLECHGGKSTRSGFDLSTREGLLRGGDSGQPAVAPGKAVESLLYRKITHAEDPGMPYKRDKLA